LRASDKWVDYELIDASGRERLERWGDIILIRPDPQVIWDTPKNNSLWSNAHAKYHRSESGGGKWEYNSRGKKVPESWKIDYKDLRFNLKPMGFKHTGLFPEQAVNWDYFTRLIKNAKRPIKVINLFAYTGGASIACAKAGASVVHVDAAKGMVLWAKENAVISSLGSHPIRYLTDDCQKFIEREVRRGSKYDAIIMDPPSYGRGPNGEVWKLEDSLYSFLQSAFKILSDNPLFVAVNSYTTGLSPTIMETLLSYMLLPRFGGSVQADEIGLPITESGFILPCGNTAIWESV